MDTKKYLTSALKTPFYRFDILQNGTEAGTFRDLAENFLANRVNLKENTRADIWRQCHRMMRSAPDLSRRAVADITPQECHKLLVQTYKTQPTQRKGKAVLHLLFAYACRHGWRAENPVDFVDMDDAAADIPVPVLDNGQVKALLRAALSAKHRCCAPALGLMLWAGIRPHELELMHWNDIDLERRFITIPKECGHRGRTRRIKIRLILRQWLQRTSTYRFPQSSPLPGSWARRWRALREEAGLKGWDADTLRHTFAANHLKHFGNLRELQADFGHIATLTLRTRYANLPGITPGSAEEYWTTIAG